MKIFSSGLQFEVETAGDKRAPAVLLTMGPGRQLTAGSEHLLTALVNAGFCVIRHDNRDIGLSSHLDVLGIPDALGVAGAHPVGVSMGGMISQRIAAAAPDRVLSLPSVMRSSNAPGLHGSSPEVSRGLLTRPKSQSPHDVVDRTRDIFRLIGRPAYPQKRPISRQHLLDGGHRTDHRAGVSRPLLATMADPQRHTLLPRIVCPTLVIHGAADPLVPLACGQETAARIPGARFEAIEGMGHDGPPGVAALRATPIVPHFKSVPAGIPA